MADVPDNRRYEDRVDTAALRWAAVTTSDTTNFSELPKAIYVGTAGIIAAVGADGVVANFFAPDGTTVLIRPKRINTTGTTASGLVALYGPAGLTA